jgi:hypothetical protein
MYMPLCDARNCSPANNFRLFWLFDIFCRLQPKNRIWEFGIVDLFLGKYDSKLGQGQQ